MAFPLEYATAANTHNDGTYKQCNITTLFQKESAHFTRGVDPYGTGGTCPPPNIWTGGDMITNVPPNISRVISATFYPCNIFLIS